MHFENALRMVHAIQNPSRRPALSAPHLTLASCRHGKEVCADCSVRSISICSALETSELASLDALSQRVIFNPRATILTQDEPAISVFNLTKGVARLYKLLQDGRRQIVGFALPGDFLGLAMAKQNGFSADAVDSVEACRFSRDEFAEFLHSHPHLLQRLHEFTSHELSIAQDQMVLLGRRTAEEKVAAFLIGFRDRWSRINQAHLHIPLPMSRQDIGDFLGLTVETVSRMMTKLARDKVIVIVPDGVRILDEKKLESLCAG